MIKTILLKLSQFFQDDTGALSALRLLFIGWGITVLIVWTILSLKTLTLIPIPPTVLTFLGSLMGTKLVQNWTENQK